MLVLSTKAQFLVGLFQESIRKFLENGFSLSHCINLASGVVASYADVPEGSVLFKDGVEALLEWTFPIYLRMAVAGKKVGDGTMTEREARQVVEDGIKELDRLTLKKLHLPPEVEEEARRAQDEQRAEGMAVITAEMRNRAPSPSPTQKVRFTDKGPVQHCFIGTCEACNNIVRSVDGGFVPCGHGDCQANVFTILDPNYD